MVGLVSATPRCDPESARIERLFALHEHKLGTFLMAMVRDRQLAEDLLQESFAVAYRERARLGELDDPEAWLFAVARRRALDALRRSRRMRAAFARMAMRRVEEVALEPAEIEVLDVLERTLAPDDRALVVLRYVHGFDASVLATITGRTPAGVRKRLERSCALLAKEVQR
jgi:RNA polymerase sigma-70 factor (ECF subfamily)